MANMTSIHPDIDLFPISKSISAMGNCYCVKLLYCIYATIDKFSCDLGRTLRLPTQELFNYLSIETDPSRDSIINDTLSKIIDNPIFLSTSNDRGTKTHLSCPWIGGYKFEEGASHVEICLCPSSWRFISQAYFFRNMQMDSYSLLTSNYQRWFYIYFSSIYNEGSCSFDLSSLQKLLFIPERKTYSATDSIPNFLSNLIGITISEAAKAENRLAKVEKRLPQLVPWDYTYKKVKKNYIGVLYFLNERTELRISACATKPLVGAKYQDITFLFGPSWSNQTPIVRIVDKSLTFEEEFQKANILNNTLIL